MSPRKIFDPREWTLPVTVVVAMLGITISGTTAVLSITSRLSSIEKGMIVEHRFAKWIRKTEGINLAGGPWHGADMDDIKD